MPFYWWYNCLLDLFKSVIVWHLICETDDSRMIWATYRESSGLNDDPEFFFLFLIKKWTWRSFVWIYLYKTNQQKLINNEKRKTGPALTFFSQDS